MRKKELPSVIAEQLGYDPNSLTVEEDATVARKISFLMRNIAEGLEQGFLIALTRGDLLADEEVRLRILQLREVGEGEQPSGIPGLIGTKTLQIEIETVREGEEG